MTLLMALCALACGSTPAMRAAQQGDRGALRSVISAREAAASLTNSEAAALARAVAVRGVEEASGDDAIERIRDVRPCARELDDALAARMRVADAAGAQAALARMNGGTLDPKDVRSRSGDEGPGWRAVQARSLVRDEDHQARAAALVDADPQVRREAARAARDARDPSDLPALLEAARLDPEPLVRTEAVRAISASSRSGPHVRAVVDGLRDIWGSADDGLREDIATAWSASPFWETGGRDALRVVVGAEHGPAMVEAAAAVLRRRDADAEVALAALTQLERAIESGPLPTRLQALAQAPLDRGDVLAVVQAAAQDEDPQVQVAALARLAETRDTKSIAKLELLSQPGSPVVSRARFALAAAGDRRIQGWIEQDLAADPREVRLGAAVELASLGVAARAAPLLADKDVAVRMRAACTLMMAARRVGQH